jgi:hypothetical protein
VSVVVFASNRDCCVHSMCVTAPPPLERPGDGVVDDSAVRLEEPAATCEAKLELKVIHSHRN